MSKIIQQWMDQDKNCCVYYTTVFGPKPFLSLTIYNLQHFVKQKPLSYTFIKSNKQNTHDSRLVYIKINIRQFTHDFRIKLYHIDM